jgi:tagatose 6-phosphate kinase
VILVVCLNPALDITHDVPAVDWAGVNRPRMVHDRPGGKGLNVARTLRALGAEALVMGLTGGLTGTAVETALGRLGLRGAFTRIEGETRRTFTVVDGRSGDSALFSEPGPEVGVREFEAFRGEYEAELGEAAAVVLSGSLPRGLPAGTYASLSAMAAAAGVPVLLDTHGEALRLGVAAGPAIVKPNLAELAALAGRRMEGAALGSVAPGAGLEGAELGTVASAAGELRAAGAQAVVVSLGPGGLWAVTAEGVWQAVPPATMAGNPTGAGDAVAAALVHGLVLGQPWEERLRHAAALGAATVAAPVAGEFRQADYARLLTGVTVSREEAA